MTTIELLEQIKKDFVKEFDNDPQINRVCKVMIHEYKLRSEALNLGVVSQQRELLTDFFDNVSTYDFECVDTETIVNNYLSKVNCG
jgi:hypothetical protein